MRLRSVPAYAVCAVVSVACWLMLNRLYSTLGTSPLVGKVYTAYSRAFSSTMSRHTTFPDHHGITQHGAFTVQPVASLDDNYAYIVTDTATQHTALVDPADSTAVLDALHSTDPHTVTHVLTTHKHWDHAQGNPDIKAAFTSVAVVGGEIDRVTSCTQPVKHGDTFTIGQSTHVRVLFTPCHTRGHVLYHITSTPPSSTPPSDGVVFTGDTLFIAGAGKFFEGTAAQMHHNLNVTIAALPDATVVYPGHEYTESNLDFAAWVEPGNAEVREKLRWAKERRGGRLSTLATSVGEEKRINPFMRVGVKEVAERVAKWVDKNVDGDDAVRVMAAVREAKNQNAHKQQGAAAL